MEQPLTDVFNLQIRKTLPISRQIQQHFEQLFASRALQPGQRLPGTRELADHWKVDLKTVHAAMQYLKTQGLIDRHPRYGTFVSSIPRKVLIGLLVGEHLLDESVAFYRHLTQNLQEEVRARGWSSCLYDNLRDLNSPVGHTNHRRFCADLHRRTLDGLVAISVPIGRALNDLLKSRLPQVKLGKTADIDYASFIHAAVAFLVQQGRRRFFYLYFNKRTCELGFQSKSFFDAIASHGLSADKSSLGWLTTKIHPSSPEQIAYEGTFKLMEQWERKRAWPDGLILADDVMMKGVGLALRKRQVQVPEQLLIVCLTAKSIVYPYAVPVVRAEFSTEEIAAQLIGQLARQMTGKKNLAHPILVKPVLRGTELEEYSPGDLEPD